MSTEELINALRPFAAISLPEDHIGLDEGEKLSDHWAEIWVDYHNVREIRALIAKHEDTAT